jgi:TetR/AcrR family transcriptional regulator, copper-responsive repressor
MSKKPAPEKKKLGRPFGFDRDEVLSTALALFWRHGFAATTMDMIAAATGVARPGLARVFGSKLDLYLSCLSRFRGELRKTLGATLLGEETIEEALLAFASAAIKLYMTGKPSPLGCLIISTAPSAAVDEPDVRTQLHEAFGELDGALIRRLQAAAARGELAAGADVEGVAYLVSGLVYSLALRARAGESERSLRATAKAGIRQALR